MLKSKIRKFVGPGVSKKLRSNVVYQGVNKAVVVVVVIVGLVTAIIANKGG